MAEIDPEFKGGVTRSLMESLNFVQKIENIDKAPVKQALLDAFIKFAI